MRREPFWSAGLILLVCMLSFGVQVPQFGFYWDDYASMVVYLQRGSDVFTDWSAGQARPVAGILTGWMWDVVGMHVLGWQGLHLVLYAASVLLFWRILRVLWGAYTTQTTLIALLFAVYPSYHLRPIPISFELIISLVFFLLSFWLSLLAAQRRSLPLALLAALLVPLYQLTYEQNLAYEALRPLAMLYVMGEWRRFLKLWLAFPVMVLLVLVYRFVLFQPNETYADYNVPLYLNTLSGWLLLLKHSIAAPAYLLALDWIHMPWRLFVTDGADSDLPGLMATVGVVACLLYLWRYADARVLTQQKVVLGVGVIGFGMIGLLLFSVHMVGRVLQDGFDSRWALSPSLMAAVMLGLAIPFLLRNTGQLVLVGLIVLGMTVQVAVNQTYIDDWQLRQELGWQMRWRAPQVAPGTMVSLVADPDYFAFGRTLTDYELTGHLNLYYHTDSYPALVGGDMRGVWYALVYDLPRQGDSWSKALSTSVVIFRDWAYDLNKLVVFGYDGGCLRTANPAAHLQSIPDDLFANFAPYAHPEQMLEGEAAALPYPDLVEPEPPPSWCFYYQRIQLALQYDHVDEAAQLADTAQAAYSPRQGDEVEWLPLIQAYNRAERPAKAESLVRIIAFSDAHTQDVVCEQLRLDDAPQAQIDLLPRCKQP